MSHDEPSRNAAEPVGAATSDPSSLILVAEDNRLSGLLIAEQLQSIGFSSVVVSNGREALARWRDGRFAAVLTDLHMPEMDGYGLTESIRGGETTGARTPIVALTASGLYDRSKRWQAVGIDACLTKPAEVSLLRTTLHRLLGRPEPDVQPDSAPRAHVPGDEPVDTAVLASIVGTEPAVLDDFLDHFARNAAEASTELEQAIGSGDRATTGFLAHRLKASAKAVGAMRLGELCTDIEFAAEGGDDAVLAAAWLRYRKEATAVLRWIDARRAARAAPDGSAAPT